MAKFLFFSDLDGEEWRAIPGYEGHYEVSNLGRIRSISRKGKSVLYLLTPRVGRWGYAYVHLSSGVGGGNKRVTWKVHRAVLFAFKGPPPFPKAIARHLNDDKLDNRAENLRWGTYEENSADAYRNGKRQIGETHKWSKVNAEIVREIRLRHKNGESIPVLSREFELSYCGVRDIIRRRVWKHVDE